MGSCRLRCEPRGETDGTHSTPSVYDVDLFGRASERSDKPRGKSTRKIRWESLSHHDGFGGRDEQETSER